MKKTTKEAKSNTKKSETTTLGNEAIPARQMETALVVLGEAFEALRTVRHHVDYGTGNALAQRADGTGNDQDNAAAVRNRLLAHEYLTLAESTLGELETRLHMAGGKAVAQ